MIIEGAGTITVASANNPQTDSQGILAQSVGGGGGTGGGDPYGIIKEIGGTGGVAASGGQVTVNLGTLISTHGDRSAGILAQSVGGGGGTGGDAKGVGTIFDLAIGGSGSGGGGGGTLAVASSGTVQTSGEQSPGMLLQSIGGGGGSGGAAYAVVEGMYVGVGIAVGGSGGSGGPGGTIGLVDAQSPTNAGVIFTTGSESAGVEAQSIGKGGGKGGPSMTKAVGLGGDGYLALQINIGGNGGAGGDGGPITLQNAGLILTGGAGSRGILAQSIGGGGGEAGDAKAVSTAGKAAISLNIQHLTVGATGGSGNGSAVIVTNDGLIVTTGADSDGVLAQSIGGGGGVTGVGDGTNGAGISLTNSTLGAIGVLQPGIGGPLTVTNNDGQTNTGAILTLGDGAVGVLAQSIGGGGGRIGGAAGNSGSAAFAVTTQLGLQTGGTSPSVENSPITLTNNGAVLTFGADAPGLVAQNIGGGGGLFGKAASSLGSLKSNGDGGNGRDTAATGLMSLFGNGLPALTNYASGNPFTSAENLMGLANTLLGNPAAPSTDSYETQLVALANSNSGVQNTGAAKSLTVRLFLGISGSGGTFNGGAVQLTNNGQVATTGKMSSGIVAQSIGGGGGIAGVANSAQSSGTTTANIELGGSYNSFGDGGSVAVQNTGGGGLVTVGSSAPGIVAQSVGAGGGMAGLSGSSTALLNALTVELGGIGGKGNGSGVNVTNGSLIQTFSHDSPAIVAQSIGGGGGLVRLLATDGETAGGPVLTASSFTYNLSVGLPGCGGYCGSGDGSSVTVSDNGYIVTSGSNAHGILAQSIGGGGGGVLGGLPAGSTFFPNGAYLLGDASSVTVLVGNVDGSPGGNISTSGGGAVAILAQSIGGGGGLAGDLGLTAQRSSLPPATQLSGNGGPILVQVNPAATVTTAADNTPVILAQSIGGGGGRFTSTTSGAYDGTAGGAGAGNTVTIDVGGKLMANGRASPGIFAESVGQATQGNLAGGAAIHVNVLPGGIVQGGYDYNPGDGYNAGISWWRWATGTCSRG